jgi:type IV secretion system protein VirB6
LQTRFVVVSELQYYEFAPPFQPLISKRQQTLMGLAMAHGSVRGSVDNLLWRVFKIAVICTLALNINNYQTYVTDGIRAIEGAMVQIFTQQDHDLASDISSQSNAKIGELIDGHVQFIERIARHFYKKATEPDIPDLPLLLAGMISSLCQIIVVSASLIPFLVAKVTLSVLLSVGPFFILLAIWPATQRFSEAWLSACLTAILSVVLVVVIVAILPAYAGHYVKEAFNFKFIQLGEGFWAPSDEKDVLIKVAELLIVTLVLSWLIYKVVSLAVALTHAGRFGQFVNTAAHSVFTLGNKARPSVAPISHHASTTVINSSYTDNAHFAHQHVIKKIQKRK